MWFGTGGGISKYNKTHNIWAVYTESGGLLDEDISAIAVDSSFVWFGTECGVSRYSKSDTPPQTGDLNSDGILTPADATIALRLAATGAHNPTADVSGDGSVTSLDALMILQATAGTIVLP